MQFWKETWTVNYLKFTTDVNVDALDIFKLFSQWYYHILFVMRIFLKKFKRNLNFLFHSDLQLQFFLSIL